MACQPAIYVGQHQRRASQTLRQMRVTSHQIRRIGQAKHIVCGVISTESQNSLRKHFEELLPLIVDGLRYLRSGALDELSDEQLRGISKQLQDCDRKLDSILKGSVEIGLEAIEPFPRILGQLRRDHEAIQSQLEGILYSLNDTFQGLVSSASGEITSALRG